MFTAKRSERVEVTFVLPNGEGFTITTHLGHGTETDRYVTALLKELDRAGQEFLASQDFVGVAKA